MSRASRPLELEEVDVVYPGPGRRARVHALSGVSLSLDPGRVTGLVGANGAGKTTLLEVAAGALRPTSGSVLRFGEPAPSPHNRRQIGFCADVPAIPGFLTVSESLEFFAVLRGGVLRGMERAGRRSAIARALERLDLGPLANRRIATLSRGNLVRLGIAQALLGNPALLILDESFAPLDPEAQRLLRAILRKEADRGAAVLVSSHQLDQVERLADGIFMMSRGRISDEILPGEASGALESRLAEFARKRDLDD